MAVSPDMIDFQFAANGYIPDIGQLTPDAVLELHRRVRAGTVIKYRGFWNNGCEIAGLGTPRACWRKA